MKTIHYSARVCPSNENYWKSEGNMIYDLLRNGKDVKFVGNNFVKLIIKNRMGEDMLCDIYFRSDRAYKRCERLYNE